MPKKDYVKRDITFVGRTQDTEDDKACGVCVEGDSFLSSAVKHDNRINYNKIEVDTPEGQKIAEDRDIDGLPYIKDCKTFEEGGKPRCREIIGFEKDEDWSDLSDVLEKHETTQAQESKKTEEAVNEPSEPNEPNQS